jgi:cytochrome c
MPVVKIKFPLNKSHFAPRTAVHYVIGVSDPEDGDTRFKEITPGEVFMEVKQVSLSSGVNGVIKDLEQPDPEAFTLIRTNNCFNCHAFRDKKIAPPFSEIAGKYSVTASVIDSIAYHVIKGSSGIWGSVQMPSHPELTMDQSKEIVRWILKIAKDSTINFLSGLDGSFRMPGNQKRALVLAASYLDHGIKNDPATRLRGEDVISIEAR